MAYDLSSETELRDIYRQPSSRAVAKQHDRLDENCRAFIAHSPFVVVATADADGNCDASPKGGPPGFVRVVDDGTLVVPDLSGNNRLDSFRNLTSNPGIALLFCIPGTDETLRVNGKARLTTDPGLCAAAELNGVQPRVVVEVNVEECYIHCAKALRRGNVWKPDRWPDISDMPSPARMLRDHAVPDATEEQVRDALEDGYAKTMWRPGG